MEKQGTKSNVPTEKLDKELYQFACVIAAALYCTFVTAKRYFEEHKNEEEKTYNSKGVANH